MESAFLKNRTFDLSISLENVVVTFLGSVLNRKLQKTKPVSQRLHSHFYGELFCCKKGTVKIVCFDEDFLLTEGDVIFMPPDILHYREIVEDSLCSEVGFVLSKGQKTNGFDVYKSIFELFKAKKPVIFRGFCIENATNMNWIDEIDSMHFTNLLSAVHSLMMLSNEYKRQKNVLVADKPNKNKVSILADIEYFINAKFYENINAETLASNLYTSPRQLARIVSERYNAPLHKVITKKRVENAAKLSTETNLSVETISSAVGFNTKSCFYNAFKNEYNLTPLQYRKTQKT